MKEAPSKGRHVITVRWRAGPTTAGPCDEAKNEELSVDKMGFKCLKLSILTSHARLLPYHQNRKSRSHPSRANREQTMVLNSFLTLANSILKQPLRQNKIFSFFHFPVSKPRPREDK